MNRYLFEIYRVVVPKPIRTKILKKSLRKKILEYFSNLPEGAVSEEHHEVLEYLAKNPLSIFPYPFEHLYKPSDIEVSADYVLGMHWVMLDGKRLYFKKRWSEARIRRGFSDLLREQDPKSPHRYLTSQFEVTENDVIADIGAAEGNFSLSVIERVKKAFIFEYNKDWARALRATFAPYGEKAEIINKMVSGSDENSGIRLDTFLKERKEITFLKIDVDGAEQEVLSSCMEILRSSRPLKIALCTYHKANDEKDFTKLLRECGFEVMQSAGYMIPFYDKKIKAPFLRRGLIRAWK
ncbi:MAG: FkbM family methyltransferase [Bacteroidales bacterium]|jgi:precorrin-6B methylase 2